MQRNALHDVTCDLIRAFGAIKTALAVLKWDQYDTEAGSFTLPTWKRGCEKSHSPIGKKQKVLLTFEKRHGGTFFGIMFL